MEQEDKRPQMPADKDSIAEICRLIAVLIFNLLRRGLRLILKCIILAIIAIIKGCAKGWAMCVKGWHAWLVFWHDDNTQEKVRKTRRTTKYLLIRLWRGIKTAARFLGKWTKILLKKCAKGIKIGCVAIVGGIIIGIKATFQGILHLRTTFVTLWRKSKQAKRAFKLWRIRKSRRYAEFKRTKGFKGLAIEWSQKLKESANNMMEEEQDEASPEAVMEEELINDEILPNSHAKKMSDKIIKYLQDIIEEK